MSSGGAWATAAHVALADIELDLVNSPRRWENGKAQVLSTGIQLHSRTEARGPAGKLPSMAGLQSSVHRFAVSVLMCDTLIYSPEIMTQGKENVKNPEEQRLLRRAGIL